MGLKSKGIGKVKKVPLKPTQSCKRMIFYIGWFWTYFRKVATYPIVKSGASKEAQLQYYQFYA
jgi:hypothetical protein